MTPSAENFNHEVRVCYMKLKLSKQANRTSQITLNQHILNLTKIFFKLQIHKNLRRPKLISYSGGGFDWNKQSGYLELKTKL